MAKSEAEVNAIATNLRNDASFSNRANSYRESLEAVGYSETEKKIQHLNSTLSVIEGLAGKIIYSTQKPEKIAELTEALLQNRDACLEIMTDQREKEKLMLAVARTEAVMKGFGMPLDMAGAPYAELNKFGLSEGAQEKVVQAVKLALKENCGKNINDIPPGTYSQKILIHVKRNLHAQGIRGQALEDCMRFAEQGKDKKRDYVQKYGISEVQLQDITTAATNSMNTLISITNKDMIQVLAMTESEKIINNAISELRESGKNISPETEKKIRDTLLPRISTLDPMYLQDNSRTITTELSQKLIQEQTAVSKFGKGEYKIKRSSLEDIGNSLVYTHEAQLSSYIYKQLQSMKGNNLQGPALIQDRAIQQELAQDSPRRSPRPLPINPKHVAVQEGVEQESPRRSPRPLPANPKSPIPEHLAKEAQEVVKQGSSRKSPRALPINPKHIAAQESVEQESPRRSPRPLPVNPKSPIPEHLVNAAQEVIKQDSPRKSPRPLPIPKPKSLGNSGGMGV